MENKYLFLLVAMLFIFPMVSAVQYTESYKIYPDEVFLDGVLTDTPEFWIDSFHLDDNGNKVYHIDALRDLVVDVDNESNNEKILLYLPYKIQPDFIQHINHVGEYVRTYFPSQWEWENECFEDEDEVDFVLDPDCEGNVILRVDKIDEGLGSNTFPIGITGPTWAKQGQDYGEFDGLTSFVNLGVNITYLNPYSISVWVKTSLTTTNQNILSQTSNGQIFWILANGNLEASNVWGSSKITTLGIVANDGEWNHVLLDYNGTHGFIYFNNVLEITGLLGVPPSNFISYIGAFDSDTAIMNGSIDEVLIYNRSLSQAEITALYNNYSVTSTGINRTGTPSTEGLVLDINFDDYSVADNSGSGNHGTNTNVSFGIVENVLKTLTATTDYTINPTTGLFTIVNDDYSWAWMNASYDYRITNNRNLPANTVLHLIEFFIGLSFIGLAWLFIRSRI